MGPKIRSPQFSETPTYVNTALLWASSLLRVIWSPGELKEGDFTYGLGVV